MVARRSVALRARCSRCYGSSRTAARCTWPPRRREGGVAPALDAAAPRRRRAATRRGQSGRRRPAPKWRPGAPRREIERVGSLHPIFKLGLFDDALLDATTLDLFNRSALHFVATSCSSRSRPRRAPVRPARRREPQGAVGARPRVRRAAPRRVRASPPRTAASSARRRAAARANAPGAARDALPAAARRSSSPSRWRRARGPGRRAAPRRRDDARSVRPRRAGAGGPRARAPRARAGARASLARAVGQQHPRGARARARFFRARFPRARARALRPRSRARARPLPAKARAPPRSAARAPRAVRLDRRGRARAALGGAHAAYPCTTLNRAPAPATAGRRRCEALPARSGEGSRVLLFPPSPALSRAFSLSQVRARAGRGVRGRGAQRRLAAGRVRDRAAAQVAAGARPRAPPLSRERPPPREPPRRRRARARRRERRREGGGSSSPPPPRLASFRALALQIRRRAADPLRGQVGDRDDADGRGPARRSCASARTTRTSPS